MTTLRITVEHVDIDLLKPDPANPRRISDAQIEALTRSMAEFGVIQPILVRREENTVIGGHQRLLAARRLGIKTVPVIYLDLSVEQSRLLNLALNRISGDWDQELLANLLSDLSLVDGVDLALTGFGEGELDTLLKSLDVRAKRDRIEAFDLDAALEAARAATRAKPGDLWALGDHRVYIGDATDTAAVTRLLADTRPAMAFCDPPYNVSLGDHGGQQRGQRKRRIANDAMSLGVHADRRRTYRARLLRRRTRCALWKRRVGSVGVVHRRGGRMPEAFEVVRDPRGSVVHVRRRSDGECIGCVETGLFEVIRALIVAEVATPGSAQRESRRRRCPGWYRSDGKGEG